MELDLGIIQIFAIRESRIANNRSWEMLKMKEHRGMRPQDVVILLKVAALGKSQWRSKDLAYSLNISASEVSESLNRSAIAGLLDKDKKQLMRKSFMEFLEYGLKYVFPAIPGRITRGFPTAYSASPLKKEIASNDKLVWPNPEGNVRGQSIMPLYPAAVKAVVNDTALYELLALVDAVRIGKARERTIAVKILRKRILK